jgi:paraquat-inducible protein A
LELDDLLERPTWTKIFRMPSALTGILKGSRTNAVSTASRYPDQNTYMRWMFVAALLSFLLGISWPVLKLSKHFYVIGVDVVNEHNVFSIASGLITLFGDGHVLLGIVLLFLSILFPLAKIAALLVLWYRSLTPADETRWLHRLSVTGKWSMADVFVISLMVVAAKLGDLVTVDVRAGVYFFGASAILTMLIAMRISKLTSKSRRARPPAQNDAASRKTPFGTKLSLASGILLMTAAAALSVLSMYFMVSGFVNLHDIDDTISAPGAYRVIGGAAAAAVACVCGIYGVGLARSKRQ